MSMPVLTIMTIQAFSSTEQLNLGQENIEGIEDDASDLYENDSDDDI